MSKRSGESADEEDDDNANRTVTDDGNDIVASTLFRLQALLEHVEHKQDSFVAEVNKTKKSLQDIKEIVESLQHTYDTKLSKLETAQDQSLQEIKATVESLCQSVKGKPEQSNKQDKRLSMSQKKLNPREAFKSIYFWKGKESVIFSEQSLKSLAQRS